MGDAFFIPTAQLFIDRFGAVHSVFALTIGANSFPSGPHSPTLLRACQHRASAPVGTPLTKSMLRQAVQMGVAL
jgi:hypothetical protein